MATIAFDSGFRGRILHCVGDWLELGDNSVEYLTDGILLIAKGKVAGIGPAQEFIDQGIDLKRLTHLGKKLLVPGFIDTHIHSAQADVIASYGEQLLKWLEKYTFPSEIRMADSDHAKSMSQDFVHLLLSHGTTTAMAFTTSHAHSCEHLFQAADDVGMCLIAGKVYVFLELLRVLLYPIQNVRNKVRR